MPENNYYSDISNEFIAHYFELLTSNQKLLENMYADNCVLIDGTLKTEGKANVHRTILALSGFSRSDNDKFVAQPYGTDEGIIITASAKIGSKPVNVTFILSEVNKIKHQYGIVFQLIHHC